MARNIRGKRVLRVLMALAFAATMVLLVLNLTVVGTAKNQIVEVDSMLASEQPFDCILVLGAGVWADGSPSHMLEDRLLVATDLYFLEASDRILMSGDHMQRDYDEVGVMKRQVVEAGIPSEAVFLDHAGLSTYESIWRAKEIYGAERVLIVTQTYHLYRAIYIAEQLGMTAYGVSADLRPYRSQLSRELREVAARSKDLLFAKLQPTPTYVGEEVDLSGNGDSTNENPFW